MAEPDNQFAANRIAADHKAISPDDPTLECPPRVLPENPPRQWGHLRVLELIGRGGSAEVYRVWDEKLERESALKLFRPITGASGVPSSREARLLARFRHNNVVTVYGVDTLHGRLGLWMELIDGRTLETVVRSDGPLSDSEACLIGIDLCRALGEVHKSGLLHRDIKPQNVMREEGGRTVLMDFGLAEILSAEDGRPPDLCGTPSFMAPEVLRGERATVASDVYSLGALLFFAVSGTYPVEAATFAQARAAHETGRVKCLAEVRPALPERFLEVVDRATAPDPRARYATTAEMKRALASCLPAASPALSKGWHEGFWRWALAASLALAVLIAAVLPSRMPVETERAAVLVTDVENQTSDPWLGTTTQDLLTVALEQSRRFYVLPRSGIAEGLALMRLPPATKVDAAVGEQLARREGISIMLAGTLAERHGRYEVVVRAVDPVENQTKATSRAAFGTKNELAAAVGTVAEELRRALGERRSDVAQTSRPLARVTTNSYEALVAYSTAMQLYGQGRPDDALPLMRRSVEADREFAMAHRQLATLYGSLGRLEECLDSVARAYALRDRATERERLLIEAVYHLQRADYETSSETYKLASALYPEDPVAQYQLAQLQAFTGDVNSAIKAMKRAIKIAPRTALYRGLLAQLLVQANRPDEAHHELAAAKDTQGDESFLRRVEGTAWLAKGDYRRAGEIFRSLMLDGATESWARIYQAQSDMLQGELANALLQLEMAAGSHAGQHNRDNHRTGRSWAARIHLLMGNRHAALLEASVLDTQSPSPATLRAIRDAGLIYAAAEDESGASRVAQVLDGIARDYPSSFSKAVATQVRGELSALQRRSSDAGRQLQEAWATWPDTLTLWSLARYRESQGDYRRAASMYQRLIDDKGNIILQQPMLLWVLAHYRLASCAFRSGDHSRAAQYAGRFRAMWRHSNIPEIREAEQMMQ